MRPPTTARSRCAACRYPCCTANRAQGCESCKRYERAERSTAPASPSRTLAPIFTQRKLQMQPHQRSHQDSEPAGDIRILSIALISALAEPHSLLIFSISGGGATPVSLAFTRQRDLQGTPGVPGQHTSQATAYDEHDRPASKTDFSCSALQCTPTMTGRNLGMMDFGS
jgi:hypothetical protein